MCTKRGLLSHLAKIYDPLGLSTPRTLGGKLIYRDACLNKVSWDTELNPRLVLRWNKWAHSLPPEKDTVPRSFVRFREPIPELELHTFGDASKYGVGAAVYAIARQPSGVTAQLVAAKGRLAKRDLTIPRLELVGAHMASNLLACETALAGVVPCTTYGWLDSTVVLYWLQGQGQQKQFVAHRVAKILQHADVSWPYVPTDHNPADLASRGGKLTDLWLYGPSWLTDHALWPSNPVLRPSPESEAELKPIRKTLRVAFTSSDCDPLERILETYSLHKTLRIGAWLWRFATIFRGSSNSMRDPLTTQELLNEETCWVKRVLSKITAYWREQASNLGLTENADGLLECRGCITGKYPIYLPQEALFTEKLVQRAHLQTLHGGVIMTMARVREQYWVLRLRQLVKRVRAACEGCKRYRVKPFLPASTAPLPVTRTEGNLPYSVIGVDFAGPNPLSQEQEPTR